MKFVIIMATPCPKSLGGGSGGHKTRGGGKVIAQENMGDV